MRWKQCFEDLIHLLALKCRIKKKTQINLACPSAPIDVSQGRVNLTFEIILVLSLVGGIGALRAKVQGGAVPWDVLQAEAEELTQEVYFKLWENLHRYKPGSNFMAWAWRVAKNLIIDTYRRARREREAAWLDPEILDRLPGSEDPHEPPSRHRRSLSSRTCVSTPRWCAKSRAWPTAVAMRTAADLLGMIEQAAAAGFDAFISGEVSEQTVHQARELGVLYLAAGHHATERYGVQALGAAVARHFGIAHRFIDIDNPV